jgi:uncharacterized protein (UPF0261 family)
MDSRVVITEKTMRKTILLIATLDTKEEEALFLKECMESEGFRVLLLDAGILSPPRVKPDFGQTDVAERGGTPLATLIAGGDKRECTMNMVRGAERITKELYEQGRIHGVISIGGAQGTDIGCTAMRALPTGVPRMMVSTIASGKHQFGHYVGTKDLTLMHSVADIQGLNFLTKRVLENAAGAICGMLRKVSGPLMNPVGIPVALSMLGTTTPGALRAKKALEAKGFEVVAFHQNGTGGIAMEDMIREGAFRGVLDLNLHEIGDRWFGGLHAAIREDRLEAAAETGVPQVVAPGSIDYTVQGPLDTLSEEMKRRKYFAHGPSHTLVRFFPEEMKEIGKIVAQKLNRSKGPVKVFIPLRGFCLPDREGWPNWDPEGDRAFTSVLKEAIRPTIPVIELDAHINDPEFIDPVVNEFLAMMPGSEDSKRRS